jgi:hypothetical protein
MVFGSDIWGSFVWGFCAILLRWSGSVNGDDEKLRFLWPLAALIDQGALHYALIEMLRIQNHRRT